MMSASSVDGLGTLVLLAISHSVEEDDVPVLLVQPFVLHQHPFGRCDDIRPAALQHSHVRSVLVEVLRDVMAAVSGPHNNHLLSLHIIVGCIVVLATVVDRPFEVRLVRESGDHWLPRVAGTPDDVPGMEDSLRTGIHADDGDGPLGRRVIVFGRLDVCLQPYVQLHDTGVCFKPICEFVFGGELGPIPREGEVGHVCELYRVVRHKGLEQLELCTESMSRSEKKLDAPCTASASCHQFSRCGRLRDMRSRVLATERPY